MSNTSVAKLLAVAEAEVGYLEKASESQLDDKTKNAGSGNFTKYGRDLRKWIGSPYANGVAWCDMFVDWVMIKAYGLQEAKTLLGGWSAYTPTSANYYKNKNQWYTKAPQVGDQIFFKNSIRICHTGIVYKVDSTRVYTIEGNTSGASGVVANGGGVCKKSYPLSYSKIAGYGRPAYSGVKPVTTTSKPAQEVCKVTLQVLKAGSKGDQVRALQILLNGLGYPCGEADGDFGTKTRTAVTRYQIENSLSPDGVVGPKTWAGLLGA